MAGPTSSILVVSATASSQGCSTSTSTFEPSWITRCEGYFPLTSVDASTLPLLGIAELEEHTVVTPQEGSNAEET